MIFIIFHSFELLMGLNEYTLLSKKKLTSDVFELQFQAKDSFEFLPGQFVTFILPKI